MVRRILVSFGLLGLLFSTSPLIAHGERDEILTLPTAAVGSGSASTSSPDLMPYIYAEPTEVNYLNAQVTFDGEGEASVALDIELNGVPEELTEISLIIPGDSVRIRRALQEYEVVTETSEYCVRQGEYDYELRDYPCLEKGTYPTYGVQVERIEPVVEERADGLFVTLPLPHAIAANESTSIALSYKVQGYATQTLGLWNFGYLTPEVPYDLDTVRVRIDVADGLTLKGGQGDVAYTQSLAEDLAMNAPTAFGDGFSSDFSSAVYDVNAFVKETTALDPNETFEVTGSYAASWWRLYWLNAVLLVAAVSLLVGLVAWGERRAHHLETK